MCENIYALMDKLKSYPNSSRIKSFQVGVAPLQLGSNAEI